MTSQSNNFFEQTDIDDFEQEPICWSWKVNGVPAFTTHGTIETGEVILSGFTGGAIIGAVVYMAEVGQVISANQMLMLANDINIKITD